jgi:hypothetical protein
MNNFNYKCLSEVPNHLMKMIRNHRNNYLSVEEQNMITIYEVNDILNDLFPKDEDTWPCQDSGIDRMD